MTVEYMDVLEAISVSSQSYQHQ